MQWPGFKSLNLARTDFDRALTNDLRKLDQYLSELATRIGRTIQKEPIASAATVSPSSGASYVTLGADSTLTDERILTAGTGIAIADGGAGGNVTISSTVSASTGANPTGTVGLSAVNGVATTFLRSDGAPALSQAITPTWTGLHTHANDIYFSGASGGNRTIRVEDELALNTDGTSLTLTAATAYTGDALGGSIYIQSGAGVGTGDGGNVVTGGGVGVNGGSVHFYAGANNAGAAGGSIQNYGGGITYLGGSGGTYDGGDIVLSGGVGVNAGPASDGGSVWLVTGEAYNGGVPGTVYVGTVATSTSSSDYLFKIRDNTGNFPFAVAYDGTLYSGCTLPLTGTLWVIGQATIAIPTHCNIGLSFGPKWGANAGVSVLTGAFSASSVGAMFQPTDNSSSTATSLIGGVFTNATTSARAHSNVIGGAFQATTAISTGAFGHGNIYGIYVRGCGAGKSSTATAAYGIHVEDALSGATPTTTTQYGIRIAEQTRATTKYGAFFDTATAGYKAIAIRDTNTYFHSSAAATMDVTATQFNVNAYLFHTGAQAGFFNVGPVTRPTAFTQTYSTASKTHPNMTAAAVTTTGATNAAPYGYTTAAQADDIITQLNKLVTDVTDLKKVVNAIIDDGQALGLLQ